MCRVKAKKTNKNIQQRTLAASTPEANHTLIRIFLNPQLFSFRTRLPSTRIRLIRQRIRTFFKCALQSEKNKSSTIPITCGRVNPDTFESEDEANSCPVCYRTINQYGGKITTTEQVCLHYRLRALWRMLSDPFYCRGALGTRVNLDTIECIWTGELHLITLPVDGEIFESGKKKSRIQKYPISLPFPSTNYATNTSLNCLFFFCRRLPYMAS